MRRDAHADWKNAEHYAPLLAADRSILAWEWLRRDPDYRRAAELQAARPDARSPSAAAQSWGLHGFELPDRTAPAARPVWVASRHRGVLTAQSVRAEGGSDAFRFADLAGLATLITDGDRHHLLLSDGLRAIRIDAAGDSPAAGPVHLRYRLSGIVSAEAPLLTLRRFLALVRTGEFSRSLHLPEARARRWLLILRAYDGLTAGADQREIAEVLVSEAAAEPRWRSRSPSLRLQAQRLARSARRMAAGEYRTLLR